MAVSVPTERKPSARIIRMPRPEFVATIERGGPELIDEIMSEWTELCDDIGNVPIFYRPEWFELHLTYGSPKAPLVLVTVRKRGQLRGVLPLQSDRVHIGGIPLRRLRAATDIVSPDHFDLIARPSERSAVAVAAWIALADRTDWDVIELADVPVGGHIGDLLDFAKHDGLLVATRSSRNVAVIELGTATTIDAALAHTDTKFRSNLRRRRRNLEKRGPVTFTTTRTADPAVLDRFFALEAAGWKGVAGSAIACDPDQRRLYEAIAETAAARGQLVLHELTCGDETVAMNFGLISGGRFAGIKLAYNESLKDFAPGHQLVHAIVAESVADGLRVVDFCGDATSWKREWATGIDRFERHWIFRPRLAPRAAHLIRFHLLPAARNAQRVLTSLVAS